MNYDNKTSCLANQYVIFVYLIDDLAIHIVLIAWSGYQHVLIAWSSYQHVLFDDLATDMADMLIAWSNYMYTNDDEFKPLTATVHV